jgi:hypothetical protein
MFSSGYRHVHQEDCESSLFTAAKTLLISHSSMSAKVPHGTASLAATLEASSHMVLQPFTPFYFHKQPTADKTLHHRNQTLHLLLPRTLRHPPLQDTVIDLLVCHYHISSLLREYPGFTWRISLVLDWGVYQSDFLYQIPKNCPINTLSEFLRSDVFSS